MKQPEPMPTHGLLTEDFKQNIFSLIQNHPLDIQTKSVILDFASTSANIAAHQQSKKELENYQQSINDGKDDFKKEAQ